MCLFRKFRNETQFRNCETLSTWSSCRPLGNANSQDPVVGRPAPIPSRRQRAARNQSGSAEQIRTVSGFWQVYAPAAAGACESHAREVCILREIQVAELGCARGRIHSRIFDVTSPCSPPADRILLRRNEHPKMDLCTPQLKYAEFALFAAASCAQDRVIRNVGQFLFLEFVANLLARVLVGQASAHVI